MSIDILLPAALRSNEGYDCIEVNADYLMGQIETSCTIDGVQGRRVEDSVIPKILIEILKQFLRDWRSESLMIYYSTMLKDDGKPLVIWARFDGCHRLPTNPDETLQLIASRLSNAFSSAT